MKILTTPKPTPPAKEPLRAHYECSRCGGTGQQPDGMWTGKAYDSKAGTCDACEGVGHLGEIKP